MVPVPPTPTDSLVLPELSSGGVLGAMCVGEDGWRGWVGMKGTRVSYNKQLNSLTAIGMVACFGSLLLPILTLYMHTMYMYYVLWAIIAVPTYLPMYIIVFCLGVLQLPWRANWLTEVTPTIMRHGEAKQVQNVPITNGFWLARDWQDPCLTRATPE